ncbi:class I SAM-dependent methyltransferase [Tenggerimyces flavus]|uniref:Class I SAM-dependent methyltransferase n=1 Tax=Tenggerimyces flavus TaxID=1708749 RepID=A0ABV7Y9S1_9ACTN|nr:class I SAM-dependent methyltransferase [Tenggerimyces flavus]MBM7783643.1 SAM-dependent methyltransferase [Tenggerimyces flavus]
MNDFEQLYASVGDDLSQVPWAGLTSHPRLVEWLDAHAPARAGRPALVIACGLGDDAEELARRGYAVTAFDYAPTAISWCHKRFTSSTVGYQVADLFALPDEWKQRFDLVVEINTIQSIALEQRPNAIGAIASTVAEGGELYVYCLHRDDAVPVENRPWPVSRADLAAFGENGLRELSLDELVGLSGKPVLQGVYTR